MDLQLHDKTALVTGSSKGIGEVIAIALAREGVHLVVHGRDREQAQRVVDVIIAQGGRAYAVLGDLTDDDAVDRLIAEAEAHVGAIGILVNNAGGSGPKDDWRTTAVDGWASSYDRNVLLQSVSAHAFCQECDAAAGVGWSISPAAQRQCRLPAGLTILRRKRRSTR